MKEVQDNSISLQERRETTNTTQVSYRWTCQIL